MASLFNTKISDTYPGLIKTLDNAAISASLKELTDGTGNQSGLFINNAGDFKASGILEFGSLKDTGENITITKFVDEADGIANNDNDTTIPTSAAVVDYVASKITLEDLDFSGDSGNGSVDLDSQTFAIVGTSNEIETSASSQQLQIGLPSSISVNLVGNVTGNLTGNVTGDVTGNLTGNTTGTVTATSILANGVTATTQNANDNSTKVATTAYVDAQVTAEDLDFGGDTGTGSVDLDSQSLSITGTTNQVTTSATNQTLNISLPATVHRNLQGNVTGNVTGNLTGDVTGDVTGNLTGNVTGNVTGDITGIGTLSDGSTAVTQSQGDNSTKIATTAYVDAGLSDQDTLAEVLAVGNTTGGTDIAVSAGDDITFTDTSKAIFGDGSDLQIYHDALNSYIKDVGTGNLILSAHNFIIQNPVNTETIAEFNKDSDVKLYFNNTVKLETVTTGVDITGNLSLTGDISSSGDIIIDNSSGDPFLKLKTSAQEYVIRIDQSESEVFQIRNITGATNPLTIDTSDNITMSGSLTIAQDLTVNGTTTTVNTQTLAVEDPLISLAKDNAANSVDIGFYGRYNDGTNRYLGLFSDASDSNTFKLFKGLEVEPTSTVDTSGTGYTKGDLVINDLDAVTISGNLTGDVTGDLTGSVLTAAQPNITSVGTLTSLDVGNIQMANALPTIKMTDTDLTNVYARIRASSGGFLFEADEANQQANTNIRFEIDGSERMRIDSSGNFGLNASAENSSGTWRNLQFGSLSLAGRANDSNPDGMIGTNFKFTTANAEQRISAHGTSRLFFNDDNISFQNAGADSAGSNIGWNTRMTINSDGNATFAGAGTFGGQLIVNPNATSSIRIGTAGTNAGLIFAGTSDELYIGANNTHQIRCKTNNDVEFVANATFAGNVGLGGTGIYTTNHSLNIDGTGLAIKNNVNGSSNNWSVIKNTASLSGSNLEFYTSTGKAKIDSFGNTTFGDFTYGSALGQVRIINNASTTPASLALFGYGNVDDDAGFANIDFAMQSSGTGGNITASIRGRANGTGENASDLAFYTKPASGSLTERMRIDSSGNVGIGGETSPDTALDVVGGNADSVVDTLTLKNDNTGNSAGAGINFVVDGVNDVVTSAIYGQRTASAYHQGSLRFLTKDASGGGLLERMRIDSNGVLQLTETSASGFINANGTALELDVNRNPESGAFGDTNKSHARIQLAGDNGGSNIKFNTASANNTTATERMRIDSKGQVGIGAPVLPSDVYTATGGGYAVLGIGQSSFLMAYKSDDSVELCQNTYVNTSGANNGVTASVPAGRLTLVDGSMVFQTLTTASNYSQTAQNVLNISTAGLVQISSNDTNQASHEQTLAIKRGLSAAGTVVPIAFVDHTHSLDVTVIVKQNTANVATGKGHSVVAYGSGSAGITQVSGSGNVTGITLAYLNTNPSGQDYVLTLTWAGSGASPDAYITIRGNSTSVIAEY